MQRARNYRIKRRLSVDVMRRSADRRHQWQE
jgi:hypothetical protein